MNQVAGTQIRTTLSMLRALDLLLGFNRLAFAVSCLTLEYDHVFHTLLFHWPWMVRLLRFRRESLFLFQRVLNVLFSFWEGGSKCTQMAFLSFLAVHGDFFHPSNRA